MQALLFLAIGLPSVLAGVLGRSANAAAVERRGTDAFVTYYKPYKVKGMSPATYLAAVVDSVLPWNYREYLDIIQRSQQDATKSGAMLFGFQNQHRELSGDRWTYLDPFGLNITIERNTTSTFHLTYEWTSLLLGQGLYPFVLNELRLGRGPGPMDADIFQQPRDLTVVKTWKSPDLFDDSPRVAYLHIHPYGKTIAKSQENLATLHNKETAAAAAWQAETAAQKAEHALEEAEHAALVAKDQARLAKDAEDRLTLVVQANVAAGYAQQAQTAARRAEAEARQREAEYLGKVALNAAQEVHAQAHRAAVEARYANVWAEQADDALQEAEAMAQSGAGAAAPTDLDGAAREAVSKATAAFKKAQAAALRAQVSARQAQAAADHAEESAEYARYFLSPQPAAKKNRLAHAKNNEVRRLAANRQNSGRLSPHTSSPRRASLRKGLPSMQSIPEDGELGSVDAAYGESSQDDGSEAGSSNSPVSPSALQYYNMRHISSAGDMHSAAVTQALTLQRKKEREDATHKMSQMSTKDREEQLNRDFEDKGWVN